jgi:hypothetical protein
MCNEKVFSTFVKKYIDRKEKKEKIDERKYSAGNAGTLS